MNRTRQSWASSCTQYGISKETFGGATAARSCETGLGLFAESRLADENTYVRQFNRDSRR